MNESTIACKHFKMHDCPQAACRLSIVDCRLSIVDCRSAIVKTATRPLSRPPRRARGHPGDALPPGPPTPFDCQGAARTIGSARTQLGLQKASGHRNRSPLHRPTSQPVNQLSRIESAFGGPSADRMSRIRICVISAFGGFIRVICGTSQPVNQSPPIRRRSSAG